MMRKIEEAYRKLGDPEDRFDIEFWQKQGLKAIYDAALEMILDAQLLKEGHADEPRLQRTVESFQRLSCPVSGGWRIRCDEVRGASVYEGP